ncbi:MAG: orotate phosphoribosyltransferase [Icmadophila ericetorum]|nr:orotate phosphoribosyltransferase [Icmadophila ericetorum]
MASDPTSSSSIASTYKTDFLNVCLNNSVLSFGTFALKSGRQSPYFFNAGLFHSAYLLRALSSAYAHCIVSHRTPRLEFDVLFGPAYKGVPLATAAIEKLADLDGQRFGNVSYSFNRKEVKDHGEGGSIVGAGLKGKKVLVIDDVVTDGASKREAIDIIKREGGECVGIVVALDRMERLPYKEGEEEGPRPSAIGTMMKEYGIPVFSVLTLEDLIKGLKEIGRERDANACEGYWARYKASD